MHQPSRPQPPSRVRPLLDEADIGSGEKSPGQQETDDIIRQIPPLPASGPATGAGEQEPAKP
ncbi:MAG: hypothetical protein QFF03_18720 [Pseudomonadota bacterium]|nr:hypothetical protein [Pseudomonadota bacterium]